MRGSCFDYGLFHFKYCKIESFHLRKIQKIKKRTTTQSSQSTETRSYITAIPCAQAVGNINHRANL